MQSHHLLLLILICVGVSILSAVVLRENGLEKQQILQISALAGILVFLIGYQVINKEHYIRKEGYADSQDESCSQTVNIYQNCGDKQGPLPKPDPKPNPKPNPKPDPHKNPDDDTPVSALDVKKWILSVDSSLTDACQQCIIENAVRIWKVSGLKYAQNQPISLQKIMLHGMLVANCSKQCVIAPPGLDRKEVEMWVRSVDTKIVPQCIDCAVSFIMKKWSVQEFSWYKNLKHELQQNALNLLLAINCKGCFVAPRPDRNEVAKELSLILVGAKPECYKCVIDMIENLWDLQEFEDFKKMSKKSQNQVVNSLVEISCKKDCVVVPSGITNEEAVTWVHANLPQGNGWISGCIDCLVSEVKKWSRDNFAIINAKSHEEQAKALINLATVECHSECIRSPEPVPESYYKPCCGN